MSRLARFARAWGISAAGAFVALSLRAQSAGPTSFTSVSVGSVTAVSRPAELDLAVALAEAADRPREWFGLGQVALEPLALIVVRGHADFQQMSRGRAPQWGAGLAFPGARTILIRADGEDPFQVLRHELAHLALHGRVKGRVPLWFDEGYAVVAAGEFTRIMRLGLNVTVARGRVPGFDQLNNGLRADRSTADAAYALAGSAVAYLADRTVSRDLRPIFARLERGIGFDSAVLLATGLNRGRFEEAWTKAVKRRYGLGLWLGAGGMWAGVAALVVVAHYLRRRRDQPRRAQLDVGWDVAIGDDEPTETPPDA